MSFNSLLCPRFVPHSLNLFAATRVTLAAAFGIPASALCIMRRLHSISRVHSVATTHAEASPPVPMPDSRSLTRIIQKRRAVLIDTIICVLFPMIQLVLGSLFLGSQPDASPDVLAAYIVQGHRFNIVERYGCYPSIYNTLLSYFLVTMWPLALGLISAIYCGMSSASPRYV